MKTQSSTEIEITRLFADDSAFVPFDMSNNVATLGERAGSLTWQASLETARATVPPLLDSPERIEAFKDFVQDSGGWTREEIEAWNETELQALFLQWIAGDVREAFGDADFSEWDWAQYEADAQEGRISSRLFKGSAGAVYFYIGN